MRVLVTGGAGAIGSNIVSRLLEQGSSVTVLDDLSSGHRHLVPAAATFINASITDDASLDRSFDTEPDYVVHAAALFANQNSVDHPRSDLDINGLGTLKVIEAAERYNAKKLVFLSSSCVYGGQSVMVEDSSPLIPETPYAVTKILGEHYCKTWSLQRRLDTVIVRLFNSYGPHEYPGRYRNVIPNFMARAMRGESLPITGTGAETRDFTFVADTVSGILGALFGDTNPGDVFNIGSGRETSILDLANSINEITGNSAGVTVQERREWDHVSRRCASIDKAATAFGYAATANLNDGLRATFDWFSRDQVVAAR